jgi:hypothetical protein
MFDDNTSGFSLSSLNLSGVQAASGTSVLMPGRYVCDTKNAKVEQTKDKTGRFISVLCVDASGKGVITARLNIVNKSAEAQRIGWEQLKGLCEHGGHPNPNNPFEDDTPNSLNGLRVGVVVKADSYQGEPRSQVGGFCDPKTVKGYEDQQAGSIGGDDDSDIPF